MAPAPGSGVLGQRRRNLPILVIGQLQLHQLGQLDDAAGLVQVIGAGLAVGQRVVVPAPDQGRQPLRLRG
jgi:hypothetical protein